MLKSINIDSELHKKLKIMSAESGAAMSALIEEGLNYILGRTPYNEKTALKDKSTKLEIKPLRSSEAPPPEPPLAPFTFPLEPPPSPPVIEERLNKPRGEIHGEDYV